MMYEKHLADNFFLHHFIRNSIFKVWQKYRQHLPNKRPLWIIPIEVIQQQTGYKTEERSKCKDLVYWQKTEVKQTRKRNSRQNRMVGL